MGILSSLGRSAFWIMCIMLFNSSVSLLIFCPVALANIDSEVWESLKIIITLSLSPLNSISLYGCVCVAGCIYVYNFLMDCRFYHYKMCLLVSSNILFRSLFPVSNTATPAFLWLLLLWVIYLFCPFTFNLFGSLNRKCASCT